MKIKSLILIALFILAIYLAIKEQRSSNMAIPEKTIEQITEPIKIETKIESSSLKVVAPQNATRKAVVIASQVPSLNTEKNSRAIPTLVEFEIDPDGWAVAYGDVLLGVPPPDVKIKVGMTKPQPINLWEDGIIPFHLPKDFPNPERVLEAFEYFKDTPITFAPYEGQTDAIVFESKPGHCRSYLGKTGGLQPVLLDKNCQPKEIAHEIMHALGFIHEHSRTDRDDYVEVLWDNIDNKYKSQFTLVPEPLMQYLKDFDFDYQSIMIYNPKAFSKQDNLTTLKSKNETPIEPTSSLSKQDIERLDKVYGR